MDTINIDHVVLPNPNQLLVVESIDYNNPYDYKALHRHDYFELIIVNKGKGKQIIDFESYDIGKEELYMIYPGQVHLMNRDTAQGTLIQFRKDLFEYIHPIKHYHLYFQGGYIPCTSQVFEEIYNTANKIKNIIKCSNPTQYANQKAYSYLQIILLTIAELNAASLNNEKDVHIVDEYLSLLTDNIHNKKKVSEYSAIMGRSADKINESCKSSLGKTALELIHEELILEIRRLLLLNEYSFKEIAYELNFDSQGNFNAFVKSKTGMTPGALQQSVLDIYK